VVEKVYDLKERTFKFAQRILDITLLLPRNPQCEILRKQLTKSGTSIGANVEEADGALTRKDFVNKMAIARKEAKETQYWLKLIIHRYIKHEVIQADLEECYALVKILSAIINKSR